jgi:hypothetical protein
MSTIAFRLTPPTIKLIASVDDLASVGPKVLAQQEHGNGSEKPALFLNDTAQPNDDNFLFTLY